MEIISKKKEATGAVGYCMLFGLAIVMVIITMYMIMTSKLMTEQHTIDDALADSALAALVADDVYYFETYESAGTPVIRFRNHDEAFGNYKSAMSSAISNTEGFFYNFTYVIFEEYEVEGSRVTVTTYSGDSGVKSTSTGSLGSVRTPEGNVVRETSCYAKVKFDLKSILDGSFITKTRDIYCTLEIN